MSLRTLLMLPNLEQINIEKTSFQGEELHLATL